MSWSISFNGTPEEVVAKIEAHSSTLADQSRIEYDDVKSALVSLVKQNFDTRKTTNVTLSAFGSGTATRKQGGDKYETVARSCTVHLTQQS